MIEVRCPECGAFFPIDGTLAGHLVNCPVCGVRFMAAPPKPAREIIDVEAEVIGGEEAPPPPEAGPQEVRPQTAWPPGAPPFQQRVYTWSTERRGGGPGCCAVGCLLLVIFVALAVQGLFSLF